MNCITGILCGKFGFTLYIPPQFWTIFVMNFPILFPIPRILFSRSSKLCSSAEPMSKFVVSHTARYGTNFYPIAFEDGSYTTFTLEIHGEEGGPDFYEHGREMYMISLESWELWHNLDQVIEDTIHYHRPDLSVELLHLVAVKRAEKTDTKKKARNQMSGSSGEKKG